jgi:hypothetical protein
VLRRRLNEPVTTDAALLSTLRGKEIDGVHGGPTYTDELLSDDTQRAHLLRVAAEASTCLHQSSPTGSSTSP